MRVNLGNLPQSAAAHTEEALRTQAHNQKLTHRPNIWTPLSCGISLKVAEASVATTLKGTFPNRWVPLTDTASSINQSLGCMPKLR